jgi:hypothetical protein
LQAFCFRCGNSHCRPSKPVGFGDHFVRFFLLGPFRCEICFFRFYWPTLPWSGPWVKRKFQPGQLAARIWGPLGN